MASRIPSPMLAKTGDEPFSDPLWIYEIKWDGYRTIAIAKKDSVELYSRNGNLFNGKFPAAVEFFRKFKEEAILDGEIVAINSQGVPDFNLIKNYQSLDPKPLLQFQIFDILVLNGESLKKKPLLERKEVLKELLKEYEQLHFSDHVIGDGEAFFEEAESMGLEGIMAKEGSSIYREGVRTGKWLKLKAHKTVDAVIVGYTRSDKRHFKSLALALYNNEDDLEYIGQVGTGFTSQKQMDLLKKFKRYHRKTSPLKTAPAIKDEIQWLTPHYVGEIQYTEFTDHNILRHPSFQGLRDDKEAKDCRIKTEKPIDVERKISKGVIKPPQNSHKLLTNPEKIFWPEEGYTKEDVFEYYRKMAETILPHLRDRPQSLHRHPNGIKGDSFYQKDIGDQVPPWIETARIASENHDINYMLCQDKETLLYMANLGCIELNPWNAKYQTPDHPTYTVMDLDPGEKTSIVELVDIAQCAHKWLEKAKVKSYLKTSGSRGLHIYIPLNAQYEYDEAAEFMHLLALLVNQELPKITSVERSRKKRSGKLYLDYLQNRPGQTLASAYCLRPKPGATVSMPLEWDELTHDLKITDFNIDTAPGRVKEKGDIMKGILTESTDMERVIGVWEKFY